jgi:hypothetical protein
MNTIVVIAFCVLVFAVPFAVFLITRDWNELEPRSIGKQLIDLVVALAGIAVLVVALNLAFYGVALASWQGLPFAVAYSGGSLARIAVVAFLGRRKAVEAK